MAKGDGPLPARACMAETNLQLRLIGLNQPRFFFGFFFFFGLFRFVNVLAALCWSKWTKKTAGTTVHKILPICRAADPAPTVCIPLRICQPSMKPLLAEKYQHTRECAESCPQNVLQTLGSPIAQLFNVPELSERRLYLDLCTMFKIVHGLALLKPICNWDDIWVKSTTIKIFCFVLFCKCFGISLLKWNDF